jgi:hypothetical protein
VKGAALPFLLGLGVGLVAAGMLINPSDCCNRVAGAVRDKVGSELGAGAQSVFDALGLAKYTPGLLNLFGVGT